MLKKVLLMMARFLLMILQMINCIIAILMAYKNLFDQENASIVYATNGEIMASSYQKVQIITILCLVIAMLLIILPLRVTIRGLNFIKKPSTLFLLFFTTVCSLISFFSIYFLSGITTFVYMQIQLSVFEALVTVLLNEALLRVQSKVTVA